MSKEKKLIDVMKHLRRFKYRITNFFQYRLMQNQKHLLLVGSKQHALCPLLYNSFGRNWRIAHMGYFQKGDAVREQLSINLNEMGEVNSDAVKEIKEKILQFSQHYEAIVVLSDQKKAGEENIITSGDIESFDHHQQDIRQALIASHLACRILYTNGMVVFTANETSYLKEDPSVEQSVSQTIKDCEIQHLGLVLGERDDLENDTLVLNMLLPNVMDEKMQKSVLEYLVMWSDGIKRPASGTFIRFKHSTHKNPIIYPDIF